MRASQEAAFLSKHPLVTEPDVGEQIPFGLVAYPGIQAVEKPVVGEQEVEYKAVQLLQLVNPEDQVPEPQPVQVLLTRPEPG